MSQATRNPNRSKNASAPSRSPVSDGRDMVLLLLARERVRERKLDVAAAQRKLAHAERFLNALVASAGEPANDVEDPSSLGPRHPVSGPEAVDDLTRRAATKVLERAKSKEEIERLCCSFVAKYLGRGLRLVGGGSR